MAISKKRKAQLKNYASEFDAYSPACKTLRYARIMLGISQDRLATRLGIPKNIWIKYETGALRIPDSMMLKIFMFGLDFWCERDL